MSSTPPSVTNVTVHLAKPRGCCAGVDRAIRTVEHAIKRYGAPIYVRHEIVHNQYVVQRLKAMGARFVEELSEIPPTSRPIILSAHGAPKSVYKEAARRNLLVIDATCPLVSKVHREAEHFQKSGLHIFLIGHRNHPEVVGTMGQLPSGSVTLIETLDEARAVTPPDSERVACVSQTTLSVQETASIIRELKKRFPGLHQPRTSDICFATTNRQRAVEIQAGMCDLYLVIGAPNSSNSCRLVDIARQKGCPALLIAGPKDLPLARIQDMFLTNPSRPVEIGLTASASAPEVLVQGVIKVLSSKFCTHIKELEMESDVAKDEAVVFRSPRILRWAS